MWNSMSLTESQPPAQPQRTPQSIAPTGETSLNVLLSPRGEKLLRTSVMSYGTLPTEKKTMKVGNPMPLIVLSWNKYRIPRDSST